MVGTVLVKQVRREAVGALHNCALVQRTPFCSRACSHLVALAVTDRPGVTHPVTRLGGYRTGISETGTKPWSGSNCYMIGGLHLRRSISSHLSIRAAVQLLSIRMQYDGSLPRVRHDAVQTKAPDARSFRCYSMGINSLRTSIAALSSRRPT
jgi:hypothetical protein